MIMKRTSKVIFLMLLFVFLYLPISAYADENDDAQVQEVIDEIKKTDFSAESFKSALDSAGQKIRFEKVEGESHDPLGTVLVNESTKAIKTIPVFFINLIKRNILYILLITILFLILQIRKRNRIRKEVMKNNGSKK